MMRLELTTRERSGNSDGSGQAEPQQQRLDHHQPAVHVAGAHSVLVSESMPAMQLWRDWVPAVWAVLCSIAHWRPTLRSGLWVAAN